MSHSRMMDMGDSTCKVSMLWNWYTVDSCFISTSWHNSTSGEFAGSVIGVFFLVMAAEGVRRLGREYDRRLVAASRAAQRGAVVAGAKGDCRHSKKVQKKEHTHLCSASEKQQIPSTTMSAGCCSKKSNASSARNENEFESIKSQDLEADIAVFRNPSARLGKRSQGPIRPTWPQQVMRGVFYGSQFSAAFLVMLIGMYYNGYMLIAIFLGGTAGYIAFGGDTLYCPQMGSDQGNCC